MNDDVTAAVEAERRRIAALLEGNLLASLNLLLAQVNVYEHTLGGNPQAHMAISVLGGLIRQTVQKTRDMQANLHPTVLETLGLEPALEALGTQVERTFGVHVTLRLERLGQRPPPPLETLLFRTIQELLDRGTTTARATHAEVHLRRVGGNICLDYRDNGLPRIDISRLHNIERQNRQAGGQTTIDMTDDLHISITFAIGEGVDLTARERDILTLLAKGMSNKEIAAALVVSARTVNFHLDNLYSKLNVNTRTEAVVEAMRRGLLPKPS